MHLSYTFWICFATIEDIIVFFQSLLMKYIRFLHIPKHKMSTMDNLHHYTKLETLM